MILFGIPTSGNGCWTQMTILIFFGTSGLLNIRVKEADVSRSNAHNKEDQN